MNRQTNLFYNTIDARGADLNHREGKALTQKEKIEQFFTRNAERATKYGYTPYEVWLWLFERRVPLTSVRARMTSLTDAGVLVKTSTQRSGEYDAPNYVWKLSRSEGGRND